MTIEKRTLIYHRVCSCECVCSLRGCVLSSELYGSRSRCEEVPIPTSWYPRAPSLDDRVTRRYYKGAGCRYIERYYGRLSRSRRSDRPTKRPTPNGPRNIRLCFRLGTRGSVFDNMFRLTSGCDLAAFSASRDGTLSWSLTPPPPSTPSTAPSFGRHARKK